VKVANYRDIEQKAEASAPGVSVRWAITDQDGAPNFAMRIFEVVPGASTPHHAHRWEHEVFVLAGSGAVRAGEEEVPLREGDVVFVAPHEKHQFMNRGAGVLRFICSIPWPLE
jgi:quercetin dioxygenase-like cupin family protein